MPNAQKAGQRPPLISWLSTAAARTHPSPVRDPSVHHIQTPAPILASVSLAKHWAALLAVVVSSSMVDVTTDSSTGPGQFMTSIILP
jgi:hypothetical protein